MGERLKDYIVPECVCPGCGARNDRATGTVNAPTPGDYSVCVSCVQVLLFNDDLTLRLATPEDMDEMSEACRQKLMVYVMAINKVKEKFPGL